MEMFDIIKAVFVRFILLCHTLLSIWRVASIYGEIYYLLILGLVPFLIEGVYTVVRRKGIEWKWLCPCFVFYLLATLPNVWLLEIQRTKDFGKYNTSVVEELDIIGLKIPIALESDTWVLLLEESLLYCIIIGRWLLPRGSVSRGQLTDLLFTFIGIASDIMELFELFAEAEVRGNMTLTYALLGLWSWSLFQFPMVLTVASKPIRVNLIEQDNKMVCIEPKRKGTPLEVLSTIVSLFMQDGPFLALRLYVIIQFEIINYGLVFFTIKNVLIILLLVYRLLVKLCEVCCPEEGKTKISQKKGKKKNLTETAQKLNDTALTTEEIIAALLSDVNAVRKRKHKKKNKNKIDNSNNLSDKRETVDLNTNITMETIVPQDVESTDENEIDIITVEENNINSDNNREMNGNSDNYKKLNVNADSKMNGIKTNDIIINAEALEPEKSKSLFKDKINTCTKK